MKRILLCLQLTATCFATVSCDTEKVGDKTSPPTPQEFNALQRAAFDNLKQEFTFTAENGNASFTSEKGVVININPACLTNGGNAVTGEIAVEFAEIFDRGSMLVSNKTTMGVMPNGDKALLISGGAFYIKVTQNGSELDPSCATQLIIPTNLTGGDDSEMSLWTGDVNADGEMVWEENEQGAGGAGLFIEEGNYYAFITDNFGWTNVDRFYSDPRPKTTIYAEVPDGFDDSNCVIYLSYDGEPNALANLDTYDDSTGLFTEHYGQIPIGLQCHAIFISEDEGGWLYAIKGVTIAADDVISFNEGDFEVTSEASLVTLINNLP